MVLKERGITQNADMLVFVILLMTFDVWLVTNHLQTAGLDRDAFSVNFVSNVQHQLWDGCAFVKFAVDLNNTGDPLHSRAACTQPCNVNTHSRAHCSPGARLCEQWGHGCVNNGARLCASARLCRGSPVNNPFIICTILCQLDTYHRLLSYFDASVCQWFTTWRD